MEKPTLKEAKKISDTKYNLVDDREDQRKRANIAFQHAIDDVNKKYKEQADISFKQYVCEVNANIEKQFIKENKEKIKESEELKGIGE